MSIEKSSPGNMNYCQYHKYYFFLNFYKHRKLKKYSRMMEDGLGSCVCTNWKREYSLVANQKYSNLHAPILRRHVSLGHPLIIRYCYIGPHLTDLLHLKISNNST